MSSSITEERLDLILLSISNRLKEFHGVQGKGDIFQGKTAPESLLKKIATDPKAELEWRKEYTKSRENVMGDLHTHTLRGKK